MTRRVSRFVKGPVVVGQLPVFSPITVFAVEASALLFHGISAAPTKRSDHSEMGSSRRELHGRIDLYHLRSDDVSRAHDVSCVLDVRARELGDMDGCKGLARHRPLPAFLCDYAHDGHSWLRVRDLADDDIPFLQNDRGIVESDLRQ